MAGAGPLVKITAAVALLLSTTLLPASVAIGADWGRYVNPRFGTIIDIPMIGFDANPPPGSDDGKEWVSRNDTGRFMVFATLIVQVDTFRQYRDNTLDMARREGVDITYSAGKRNWFVYSGYYGDDIVYEKVVVTRGCSSLIANHLYLKYPIAQKKRYDPIVSRMAKSLRASRLGSVCN